LQRADLGDPAALTLIAEREARWAAPSPLSVPGSVSSSETSSNRSTRWSRAFF